MRVEPSNGEGARSRLRRSARDRVRAIAVDALRSDGLRFAGSASTSSRGRALVRYPRHLRLGLLLALGGMVLFALTVVPWVDPDLFHEIALWREVLRTGAMPRADVWAYTPTLPRVVHHEWGTGAVLHTVMVASGAGATGLFAMKLLLVGGIVAAGVACARARGAPLLLATIAAAVALWLMRLALTNVRAQLFTLLFTALLLLLLEVDHRGRRWWVALWLPLYVVWLNLHAGFVVGVGLYALHAAERVGRVVIEHGARAALRATAHLVVTAVAMALLLLASPYGADLPIYVWDAIRMERPAVAEWAPLWDYPAEIVAAFEISVLLALYGAYRQGWRSALGVPLLAASAYLATRHVRHLSIYAVVWLCLAPGYLDATAIGVWLRGITERHARAIAIGAAAIGAVSIALAISGRFWEVRIPTRSGEWAFHYPSGAVDYLARHRFRGNVFTPFESGAFVSWRLHPAVRVSFDGRYEVAYRPGAMERWQTAYAALDGWRDALAEHGTDAVLVPLPGPLDTAFAAEPSAWPEVYRDDGYSVRVRPERARELPVERRTGAPIPAALP